MEYTVERGEIVKNPKEEWGQTDTIKGQPLARMARMALGPMLALVQARRMLVAHKQEAKTLTAVADLTMIHIMV